jgi:hypothetical protein
MESSIAVFLMRWPASELPPTTQGMEWMEWTASLIHFRTTRSAETVVRPQRIWLTRASHNTPPSQRSLHNAPIFRLLLKVAVNGTHQCDFLNF